MAKNKRLGAGAKCSVLIKFLHPSKLVKETLTNPRHNERLDDLIAIREERKKVNRKDQVVVAFRHCKFDNQELHCVKRFVKVVNEGHPDHFFNETSSNDSENEDNIEATNQTANGIEEQQGIPLPNDLTHFGNRREDIATIRGLGLMVDDDNDPAPENIPPADDPVVSGATNDLKEGQSWGWNGFDERKVAGIPNVNPSMKGINNLALGVMNYVAIFLLFMPRLYLEDIVLNATNKHLEENPLSFGELLSFIGIILFMSTVNGNKKKDFWSNNPISMKQGAPYRFHQWMSRRRFDEINHHLQFTDNDPPSFVDKFWEVRQMIAMWNTNMSEVFLPGWICCLDESMSIWFSRWTCPGWVFCPRKPHPWGNEYHTISCGLSGIMFWIEMVEGEDRPKDIPAHRSNLKGNTVGLLLRLCMSIYHTGRVVILDSGFCVLQGLIELRKRGVYASAVIKKRRYWPKHVPGKAMDDKLNNSDIGTVECLHGQLDNVNYNMYAMKEPDFVMKMMATYGALTPYSDEKDSRREISKEGEKQYVTFKYTEPYSNHYRFRHSIDDHNNLRHQVPSIEGTWITKRWPIRVFSFILAISEVNAYLAFRKFIWHKKDDKDIPTLREFRRNLAISLIENEFLNTPEEEIRKSKRGRLSTEDRHVALSAPPHAQVFVNGKWKKNAKFKYQQYTCRGTNCKKKTRLYCKCNPGHWLCSSCHLVHVVAQITEDNA